MKPTGELFTIRFNDKQIAIETYNAKGFAVYCVKLTDQEQIFITKTVSLSNMEDFWTSVPEGNLELAKQIGDLIDQRNNLPKQSKLF